MGNWESIPGETPIDPSGLKVKGVENRQDLAVVEARNIRIAVMKYLAARPGKRSAPFDVVWLLRLHREMFGEVWEWAGSIRSVGLNLGAPPHQIRDQLGFLVEALHSWSGYGHGLDVQAVWLHHRAVQIHPFLNGNGRWARLLANIWLRQNGAALTLWPEQTVGNVSPVREEYLAAIRTADQGDYKALANLHSRLADVAHH